MPHHLPSPPTSGASSEKWGLQEDEDPSLSPRFREKMRVGGQYVYQVISSWERPLHPSADPCQSQKRTQPWAA